MIRIPSIVHRKTAIINCDVLLIIHCRLVIIIDMQLLPFFYVYVICPSKIFITYPDAGYSAHGHVKVLCKLKLINLLRDGDGKN